MAGEDHMASRLQSSARDAKPRRQALVDLLERVKGAEGSDRELDARLYLHLMRGPQGERLRELVDAEFARRTPSEREFFILRASDWQAPKYTASLDATVTLVERLNPDFCWRVHKQVPSAVEAVNGAFWATCGMPGEQEDARGHAPALALLSALLTALLSQEEDA